MLRSKNSASVMILQRVLFIVLKISIPGKQNHVPLSAKHQLWDEEPNNKRHLDDRDKTG